MFLRELFVAKWGAIARGSRSGRPPFCEERHFQSSLAAAYL
jgi:hypothetical protein